MGDADGTTAPTNDVELTPRSYASKRTSFDAANNAAESLSKGLAQFGQGFEQRRKRLSKKIMDTGYEASAAVAPRRLLRKPSLGRLKTALLQDFGEEDERAAIMVQRRVRLHWNVYKHFGPSLFVTSDGLTGQAGQIMFPARHHKFKARWIRLHPSTAALRLDSLLTHYYQLPPPEVLITGKHPSTCSTVRACCSSGGDVTAFLLASRTHVCLCARVLSQ